MRMGIPLISKTLPFVFQGDMGLWLICRFTFLSYKVNLKLGPMYFISYLSALSYKLSVNVPHPLSGICSFLFPLANVGVLENPAFHRTCILHLFLAPQVEL